MNKRPGLWTLLCPCLSLQVGQEDKPLRQESENSYHLIAGRGGLDGGNPVRAHLLGTEDRLLAYPWSSFGWYLAAPEHRPGWMRVDRLLGEHGIQEDSAVGRQEFERHMEARRLEEADEEELKPLRRGWCLGSEQFRQEMLERMDGKLGENHSGELRRETAEQKANRIVSEELSRRGWTESDLAARQAQRPGQAGHRCPGKERNHIAG